MFVEFNLSAGLFIEEKNFLPLDTDTIYDVLIIGGGPAGLTAAVYCLRKGLVTGLITGNVGGQMTETAGIENYLGYRYINGNELIDKFRDQVVQFGIAFESGVKVNLLEKSDLHLVYMEDGRIFKGKTVIIASGKQSKKLNVPGERELTGHGVAYCAICDAPFYADKTVVVVGGGNSGLAAAIDLAKIATHVTIVQRRDRLTGDQILIDKLAEFVNVRYLLAHEVSKIKGEKHVESVIAVSRQTGAETELPADGIFVEIGLIPNSLFARGLVATNAYDEIIVDCFCRTDVAGVFAAGDVTSVPYKQIIIACGEGAKAALSAADYIMNTK
jgi:NADH-dependent peroxiredoxin subunit F